MYASHFGLRTEPFSLTPDPAFLYLSPDHAEALAGLKIGLESRRGLMLMIAEVGMGKTTLLYSMLDQLDPQVHTAYLSNTRLSFDDLLRQALADLGQPCVSRDRVDLLTSLNTFLHERAAAGETAALIIDEAQNLDEQTFENLRLLSNYETYTDKLLQIVLVGQPELDAKLSRPSLRQVTERVAVRCHINPLTMTESIRYLEHRLQVAGGSTALFTPTALRFITWKARGIPRRLNIICHNALLFAYGRGERRVSLREARAAIREKQGRGLVTLAPRSRFVADQSGASDLHPWRIAAAGAAGVAFALGWGSGYLGGRSDLEAPVSPRGIVQLNEAAAAPKNPEIPQAVPTAPEGTLADAPTPAPSPIAEGQRAGEILATVAPVRADFLKVVVPNGTSLSMITQKYFGEGDPQLLERIRDLNPQIVDVDRIVAGDTLLLPALRELDPSHE